jgi:outer membrane protein assembly factor BamD
MVLNRRIIAALFGLFVLITVVSCKSKFEKIKTSNNIGQIYQEAIKYFNARKYEKAGTLFELVKTHYRARPEAEDLYFYIAQNSFNMKDYATARYHFEEFSSNYPNSARAEEARYMGAYCLYLESPRSSLDQTYTYRAINALQLFINYYPASERVGNATELIDELRDRLERKAFENAKLYLDMGLQDDYRAAVIAFDNVLRDFPDTKYAEEMEFLSIKAQYLYAVNSFNHRKEERFNQMLEFYDNFVMKYPESRFMKDADQYRRNAEKGIEDVKRLRQQQSGSETTEVVEVKDQNGQN